VAILASRLRVTLPGITGTLSVNFLFIWWDRGTGYSEAMTLGAVSMVAQSLYRTVQLPFSNVQVCAGSLSTALAYVVYHNPQCNALIGNRPLICADRFSLFHCQRGKHCYGDLAQRRQAAAQHSGGLLLLVFPYYLVGAELQPRFRGSITLHWETSLLFVPASISSTAPTGCIWASWKMKSGTWKKWRNCICEPLRLWLWPLKPRIRLRTTICSGAYLRHRSSQRTGNEGD